MICETVLDHLDDYLEGTLEPGERAEVEGHLKACATCRAEAEGLAALLARARALPRSLEPERDLWPSIGDRVRAGSRPPRIVRRSAPLRWGALAAGAALLVLATASLTYRLTRPAGPPKAPAAAAPTVLASMRSERAGFLQERQRMLTAFEARKPTLRPDTVAVVERNLAIIDNALAEIDAALRKDPNNADLGTLLAGTYRQELALLDQAARMNPEPMRGGIDHAKS